MLKTDGDYTRPTKTKHTLGIIYILLLKNKSVMEIQQHLYNMGMPCGKTYIYERRAQFKALQKTKLNKGAHISFP
jgi:hypothetical protein